MVESFSAALVGLSATVLWSHGIAKLRDLRGFSFAVSTWKFVPTRHVWMVTLLLPFYEVALATALGIGVVANIAWDAPTFLSIAVAATLATSSVFVAGQVLLLISKRKAFCGCSGRAEELGAKSLGRAALLGACCLPWMLSVAW